MLGRLSFTNSTKEKEIKNIKKICKEVGQHIYYHHYGNHDNFNILTLQGKDFLFTDLFQLLCIFYSK